MPFFSVIIPVFNRSTLVRPTLDSVLSQTFTDYEIIAVDDGSSDDSLAVLRSYGDRVCALSQANAGPGAARNTGIQAARSEYVAFLDSDDLWMPWTLETIATVIAAANRPGILQTNVNWFLEPKDIVGITRKELSWSLAPNFWEIAGKQFCGAGSTVVRRQILLDAGGFATARAAAEDLDLLYRIARNNVAVIHTPATFSYRRHSGNITSHVDQWYAGVKLVLGNYRAGRYVPSGASEIPTVRRVVARYVAFLAESCLIHGSRRYAFKAYCRFLPLALRAGMFDYLIKMPLRALLQLVGKWPPRRPVAPAAPATSPASVKNG